MESGVRNAVQKTFSPSSLNCFEKCPKQYWFRYVAKVPVETEGIEAFVGKLVHEVLERLYLFVSDGLVPSIEKVVYRYHQLFDEKFDGKRIRIVREDTNASFYRSNGVRSLENYYRRFYPFDGDQTLGLEKALQFHLDDEKQYAVRGIIDRVVRAPDGVLEIHDFKTGRRIPRQEELDRDRQLGLYELGLRKLWNESGPIRLVWHYLLSNQVRTSERSPEQREALRHATTGVIDRIRNETEWKTKKSALCDWCEYREHCPLFGGAEAEARLQAGHGPAKPADTTPAPAPQEGPDGQLRLL